MDTLISTAHYLHWGWLQISPANLIVIAVMVAAFIAAVAVQMPSHKGGDRDADRDDK